MKQRWYRRAALAATVGLGIAAGLARGESPAPPVAAPYPAPNAAASGLQPVPVSYGQWYAEQSAQAASGCSTCGAESEGGHHRLLNKVATWVHNCPGGCWSHHDSYGCSSLQGECKFIFGNCRTFWDEPCMKTQPISPIPPPGIQVSPPISVAPGYAPAASGLAPYSLPPGPGLAPPVGSPTTINPQGTPTVFDYGAVPSSRVPASQVSGMQDTSNYQYTPGGYR